MENMKTDTQTNGPLSCGTEPVSRTYCDEPDAALGVLGGGLTFASVLNVADSDPIWPGEASVLFFGEYFAERLVGEDYVYCNPNAVWEHMREEILRLCNHPEQWTLETLWNSELAVDCHRFTGSLAGELYSDEVEVGSRCYDEQADDYFAGDGCEDNDEPDTMNSELLLTEEYVGPEKPKAALDSVRRSESCLVIHPRRRVWIILPLDVQPTERKD